ncbi:hybrid sensor histidine kinase/response regulator [Vibrio albus]|uniref:histidine kinase n=1 Tax=Vibrio albus TaxID=2200953 RepID=A0A2U3B5U3_9VIBR|nr:ATP-binding protein [Vibrio albus]PWI32085.1 hybrid sensor histidine kinase/response regulator [Vibrio albus]
MGAFLLLSLIPLTSISLFFLHSHSQDLQEQSHSYLQSVRDTKRQQLLDYFNAQESYVLGFVRSELAYASGGKFYGLINAFRNLGVDIEQARNNAQQRYIAGSGNQIKTSVLKESENYAGSERYRLLHKRYHRAYIELLKRSDFDDILLVDREGNVAYSTAKHDNFGHNLLTDKYRNTNLGKTFQQLKQVLSSEHSDIEEFIPIVMSDFATSDSSENSGKSYAWFGSPIIQHGYLHSYALLRLPIAGVSRIVTDIRDKTEIKTLLVGNDMRPRSLGVSPEQITTSQTVVQKALSGDSNVGSYINKQNNNIIAAYSRLRVHNHNWALVTEIEKDQAYARIYQLKKIFVVALAIAVVLVIVASHFLSNFITYPLLKLTWAAEKVSAGDLDTTIINTDRKDEIGRLAVSFERMQRSIREKITTIRAQNQELEKNITLIRKQNDELHLADKLKDDFLATTSHELRTPLHGMIGIAEALASGDNGVVPPNQRYQLDIIINSGERLAALVDDLLDYHKMRYGNLEIHLSAVDLASATSLVLELSCHLISKKGIRIINQIPDNLPLVSADPQRLEQVLYNLIGNAIKYTDEGKIVISATVLDEKVRIQVVDTGQGIPPEYLEQIFEPLTQNTTDSIRYRQGAGLGLSISRQLIELMGGILYVSSQPLVGTTFSFYLPLATEKEKQASPPSYDTHFQLPETDLPVVYTETDLPENSDGPLIMITDDEAVNIQILNSFLRLEGYRTRIASNGHDTLKLIEEEKPDLLLLDLMMPGICGYEVCESLRTQYDRYELPVIMLSTQSQTKDRIIGFESGANDYLTKPFNRQELVARIDVHLTASRTEKQRQENRLLQAELNQKKEVETNLLKTQKHLLQQLDFTSDAIICVQKDLRIRYANEAAIRLFNRTEEQLKRSGIDEIVVSKYLRPAEEHFCGGIDIFVGDQYQRVSADIFQLPEHSGLSAMYIFNTNETSETEKISKLETAVEALSCYAFDGDISKLNHLKSIGDEYPHITGKLNNNVADKQEIIRSVQVEIMITALEYWKEATGQSKFEFAEKSGLWRVYLDRCTLQTRTLDKYLQLETLPKTPRWRTVIKSADYILQHCEKESGSRHKLEQLRNKLHRLQQQEK